MTNDVLLMLVLNLSGASLTSDVLLMLVSMLVS